MKLRTFKKLNVFLGFWHWTIYLARCTCDYINHYGIAFFLIYFSSEPSFVISSFMLSFFFFVFTSKSAARFIMADHDTDEENVLAGGGTSYSTEHHRSTSQWELSLKNPITQWPHIWYSRPPSLTRQWGIVVLFRQYLSYFFFITIFSTIFTFLFSYDAGPHKLMRTLLLKLRWMIKSTNSIYKMSNICFLPWNWNKLTYIFRFNYL